MATVRDSNPPVYCIFDLNRFEEGVWRYKMVKLDKNSLKVEASIGGDLKGYVCIRRAKKHYVIKPLLVLN